MDYFGLIKDREVQKWLDVVIFGVGGAAHLFPTLLASVTSMQLFAGISVQMLTGALMLARLIDMKFVK